MGLPDGYQLRVGTKSDRTLLLDFMYKTYQEFFLEQKKFSHLADTVAQYFSQTTPLWWIEFQKKPVGCLWMGSGVDQITGQRYSHIFIVYVSLEHRRKGIGSFLMNQAEIWAKSQGNFQLGLQVFNENQPAVNFYEKIGFKTQSLLMIKPFN
ncbi:GNAT family N-acetyltransferase [Aphanothece hegewaldii CCALA 016]|uniref:GNAT family N-acetyltransferase n=1 Tax=Aphanothece hegewaldii CCALA 016 TaxID=2107694 RepID=A0A2T1LWT8_9CHRO|nr:GNAT family N-acetyltransferase [Aphanothece hegewaldii]PSF36618.1 GNAT family N-acetyltransferase [Aphanothece hegewaldii CCALA 016]